MGHVREGLVGAWLCAIAAAGNAATYVAAPAGRYTNDGSLQSPWNLARAAEEAAAGDTVELRGGVYAEVLHPRNGGTPAERLVFRARSGELPLIAGSSPDDRPVEITTDYVTLDGISIKKALVGRGKQYNVLVSGDHVTIRNCSIIGTRPVEDRQSGVSESGIRLLKPSHGTVIENCEIAGLSHAGVHVGDGATRVIVRRNDIYGHYLDAIRFDHSLGRLRESLVEDNNLHGSIVSDGIQFNGNFNSASYPRDVSNCGTVIRRNRIYGNAENGIDLKGTCRIVIEANAIYGNRGDNDGSYDPTPTCGSSRNDRCAGMGGIMRGGPTASVDVIVRRNVVYDNRGGIALAGDGWAVYGNTVVANNRDFTGPSSSFRASDRPYFNGIAIDGAFDAAAVKNNLVGGHFDVEARSAGSNVAVDIDGNVYFNVRGPRFSFSRDPWHPVDFDSWRRSLAGWSRVFGDEGSSRVVTSPRFVDVPVDPVMHGRYDFALMADSPAIDAGVALTNTLAGGFGRDVPVENARYFSDGMRIVDGDHIRIDGVSGDPVVTAVDYARNRLTLDRDVAWSAGAGVHLAFAGMGPDVGAVEYGAGAGRPAHCVVSAGAECADAGSTSSAGADSGDGSGMGGSGDGSVGTANGAGTGAGDAAIGPAGFVAAQASIDIFHAGYGRFDFTLTNDAASGAAIADAVLEVDGTEFDALDTTSTLSLSPTSLGSNNGVTATVATIAFGNGLLPGASAHGRAGDFDPYPAPTAIDIVVTYANGATLSGEFARDGDIWRWSAASRAAAAEPFTVEAESLSLDGYSVENGNRIRLTNACCQGTASMTFPEAPGRYDLTIVGVSESDGPARIDVAVGGRAYGQFTFAVAPIASEFVLSDLALATGDRIEITGAYANGAFARIDRLEFMPRAR